jgi:hypothetical protein
MFPLHLKSISTSLIQVVTPTEFKSVEPADVTWFFSIRIRLEGSFMDSSSEAYPRWSWPSGY